MCRIRLLAALGFLAAACVHGQSRPQPQKSSPLAAAFVPAREVVLVEDGMPCAMVALPQDPAYAAAARQVLARLKQALGVDLPTVPEADLLEGPPGLPCVIVCGAAHSGPFARQLYANKLIASDALYPGPGGHEFRTIPFALDTGAAVVFLGGSTPDAVLAAATACLAKVGAGERRAVPYTIDWVCRAVSRPEPLSPAAIEGALGRARSTLAAFRSNRYRSACRQFCNAAQDYYLSGEPSHARLAAQLAHLLAKHYGDNKVHPPTFEMSDMVMALDQVDECPAWTDEDRLVAAEWIRVLVEDTMDFWEMRWPIRHYQRQSLAPIWNHETFPALSIAHGAMYLRSRYRVPAAAYWEAVVEHLFEGQITCDQPLEDSANYQWSVPRHTLAYVLATGRLREYFTNGSLAQCMEYAIASHDSNGHEATHGDAWQPFGSCAQGFFNLTAALLGDGRYQWVLNRIGSRTPGLWGYPSRVQAREPTDHVGLRVFMVHPARADAYGIEGLPPDRVLDKAVFRSGWDSRGDYLMFDGLNVGNHKHLDANAIIRFSSNRRYWLVDMDYIRAAPKHHNSIVVTRDGLAPDQRPASHENAQVIAQPPLAAELLCHAGTKDRGLLASVLYDYDGLDWSRSIFWQARDFFVVLDTLTAVAPGDYAARAVWRTLGDAALDGRRLHVQQAGEHRQGNDDLRIVEDDGRKVVELLTRGAAVTCQRELAPATYRVSVVAKGLNGSSDSVWMRVADGPRQAYHLPIGKYGDSSGNWQKTSPTHSLEIKDAGPRDLEITLREAPGVCLDKIVFVRQEGEPVVWEAEELVRDQVQVIDEPEQHFFIVNADGSQLKLRNSFDYGHGGPDGYFAKYRYAGKITRVLTQTKQARLARDESLGFANLFYLRAGDPGEPRRLLPLGESAWVVEGDSPAVVGIGPCRLDGLRIDVGLFMLTPTGLLTAGAQGVKPAPDGLTPAAAQALLGRLVGQARPAPGPAPAPALSAKPLAVRWRVDLGSPVTALAGGELNVLAGTAKGEIARLNHRGDVLWRRSMGSKVRAVAWAKTPGPRPLCVAGTDGGQVAALHRETGEVVWAYTCEPYHGRRGSVGVVFPADLDGDGRDEVVAGSDNHHYHGLSGEGKLLWRTNAVHACTAGCAGDLDDDGRDEIMAGTEYYWPRVIGPTGKLVGRASGGPVTTAAAIFDLDGDGKPEALYGMEDGFLRCRSIRDERWCVNVGGAATAIRAFDADFDGKLDAACASEGMGVYALNREGKLLWRRPLTDSVNGLAALAAHLAAGCDDGRVYALNRMGLVVGAAQCPGPVTHVEAIGPRVVVAASGSAAAAFTVE